MKIKFKEGAKVQQQKGSKVPVQIHKGEDAQIKACTKSKLPAAGHIESINKTTDEMFIQSVVKTVKKDRSVNIALKARSLNNAIFEE